MGNNKNSNSCDYCNYCDYCDSCNSCNYCKNLRMTEYNLFCYSKNYNDNDSFQQERYRAFNKIVGEKRYLELINLIKGILQDFKPELNNNSWSDEWGKVTPEQWRKLLEIPEAKDFKEGFEYISGIKINVEVEEMTVAQICEALGKEIKVVK